MNEEPMRTLPRGAATAIATLLTLAGCSQHLPPSGAPTPPKAESVTAQKWFSVDKHNPWYWSCLIRVTPDKGGATHLTRGMQVAWVLVNDCDDSSDLELRFFRNGQPVDSPITFEPVANGVLRGVVKADLPDVPPTGLRFKYSARSGRHNKDPEIVIFP
jgi:hypothetical protein